MKPGLAAMSIFVGLNASNEELGLKAQNTWAFTSNAAMDEFDNYLKLDKEEVQTAEVPLVFVSFPSAKDPNWRMHPGRESKSTCAIITLATWDWYKKWESKPLKRRGDDYDAVLSLIKKYVF
jgi:all-trans-retinol 13,14-reductase